MTAIVLRGDARHLPLPDASVDLIVTSPPYFGLRSYTDGGGHYDGQIGSEASPGEWVAALVACTAEWVRVLKPSGSIFVNLGDKFSGSGTSGPPSSSSTLLGNGHRGGGPKIHNMPAFERPPIRTDAPPKSLLGLPWRYALACMDELGLILRRDIIWSKPNGLPESVTDRCRSSHEYLFHFTVRPRYYAAVDEIREPHNPDTHARGRNGAMSRDGQSMPTWGLDGTQSLRGVEKRYTEPSALGKLPGSVWEIPSQPLSVPAHLGVDHFAAFPMELPRRCILGWSPPGICTGCGEGRRPVTSSTYTVAQNRISNRFTDGLAAAGTHGKARPGSSAAPDLRRHVDITGYACGCPDATAPVRPAVVVDPFGGTGTTALVASMLGRTGVSVDLSMDYARLAKWRTSDPGERARALQVPKPPPVPDGQASLFDDLPA